MPIVKALRPLYGDYGLVHEGQSFEVSEDVAVYLAARGLISYAPVAPPAPFTQKSLKSRIRRKAQPRAISEQFVI